MWISANYAQQLSGSILGKKKKRSFTLEYMCSKCHRMPKHNYTWFLAKRQDRNKKTCTRIWCTFCNDMSKATCRHDAVQGTKGKCVWCSWLGYRPSGCVELPWRRRQWPKHAPSHCWRQIRSWLLQKCDGQVS